MFQVSRIRLAAPVVLADVLCAGPATAEASSAARDAQRSADDRRRDIYGDAAKIRKAGAS